ncbi:MAG TPA: AMP-binding protein, partial [Bacillota bacterium]|nr:AMP-binding protein [Bacillota bacterium]
LYQYHESYGTTGTPVSVWMTRQDLQINAEALTNWGVNFRPGDTVMVRFPYAISSIAHTVTDAVKLRGACVVPVSSRSLVSPFTRVVKMMQKLQVTVLAGLPLQALLMAETAELMGLNPREDFPCLRALCTAGEMLSPGRRKTLEEVWGVPVFDNYGMTEIGVAVVDCEYQQAHPQDADCYFEVLREDLKTPAEIGETGLLVVTTLRREATPLLRYLTGDRARLLRQECSCGAQTVLEVRGRMDYVQSVSNRQVDLWDIEEIVSRLPCRRFWVAAPAEERLDLVVEEEAAGQIVTAETVNRLEQEFQIGLSVTVVPKGTLYDREDLLSVGVVGKPQYLYTPQEMAEQKYLKSVRV